MRLKYTALFLSFISFSILKGNAFLVHQPCVTEIQNTGKLPQPGVITLQKTSETSRLGVEVKIKTTNRLTFSLEGKKVSPTLRFEKGGKAILGEKWSAESDFDPIKKFWVTGQADRHSDTAYSWRDYLVVLTQDGHLHFFRLASKSFDLSPAASPGTTIKVESLGNVQDGISDVAVLNGLHDPEGTPPTPIVVYMRNTFLLANYFSSEGQWEKTDGVYLGNNGGRFAIRAGRFGRPTLRIEGIRDTPEYEVHGRNIRSVEKKKKRSRKKTQK